jgi:hypothetical protein
MLGVNWGSDEFGRLVRVAPPKRLSRWTPIPIIGTRGPRSPFAQFHLLGEIDEGGQPAGTTSTEPILYIDGRYVVTTSGDDYLLEDHSQSWTPPKKFNPDEPFGRSRFHGPFRFYRQQRFFFPWIRRRSESWLAYRGRQRFLVANVVAPLRLIDWTAFEGANGIVISGIVHGHPAYAPNTRLEISPVFTCGRFVKAGAHEYVLHEPALEHRVAMRGHDPRRPLIGLGDVR